jgi:hypothetical protein
MLFRAYPKEWNRINSRTGYQSKVWESVAQIRFEGNGQRKLKFKK